MVAIEDVDVDVGCRSGQAEEMVVCGLVKWIL